jgi:predicted RNA-binding protein YlqC (UPF0109 family)
MNDYVDLVSFIVKSIVDHPDEVQVDAAGLGNRSQTVEVRLHPDDVGRVIGKSGRNIEAIRALVRAASVKDRLRINVEVITEDAAEAEEAHQPGVEVPEASPAVEESPVSVDE